ncbi:MAG: SMC-Scp complex subunit ScpB [Bacteroidota bacterium]
MQPPLEQIVESIIFVAEQPVSLTFLLEIFNPKDEAEATDVPRVTSEELEGALAVLMLKYEDDQYPFEVKTVAGGYQFFTKRAYYPFVRQAVLHKNQRKLSRAAMETLAIVAYRQPITKAEVEFIRGVNCDYALQKLLEKQLLSINGRSDAPGRPLLYATSLFFMQYFGINELGELPKLKEFEDLAEDHLEEFRQYQLKDPSNDQSQTQNDGQATQSEEEKPQA